MVQPSNVGFCKTSACSSQKDVKSEELIMFFVRYNPCRIEAGGSVYPVCFVWLLMTEHFKSHLIKA